MRTWLAALAVIFLVAHLAFLAPTLEDIDSINFALGVRDFDVGQHRPHPPGAPVFIALGKASTAALRVVGVPGAESRGLAVWSVLAGAALIPLVFALVTAIDGNRRRAFWTAALSMTVPLAWFTASRPMSDMTGLALAVAAQALIVRGWLGGAGPASLIAGAFVAGIAIGVRVQPGALTIPLLLVACASAPLTKRTLLALLAFLAGVLAWGIPLIVVSGGLGQYLAALQSQAGEDFAWVRMLWTSPTDPRVAFHAFVNSFVWPWGRLSLGVVALALSTIGLLWTAWRTPRTLAVVLIAFGPYAVFHLLFQETTTLRYALPLVIPMAYLVVRAADAVRVSPYLEIAIVAASLVVAVPQTTAFREGNPGFHAMAAAVDAGGVITGHPGMLRVWESMDDGSNRSRYLRAPHGFEWLTLVEHWRANPDASAQFIANPRRTDHLVLFDPQARTSQTDYTWDFPEWPLLGGARPGAVSRIVFRPPGWMLDRGWATSAEVAGITETEEYGPHLRPSVVWVRPRVEPLTLMLGGRHLGAAGDPDVDVAVDEGGRNLATWTVKPGYFFNVIDIPGGISGAGYVPLTVMARSAGQAPVRVGLEQFDLQPPGVPMVGLAEGWYEPEYDRTRGKAWRWISERAVMWVRPVGRDVTVTLHGESPAVYHDGGITLRAKVGTREIATLSPTDDFTWEFVVPAADLDASAGRVVIESDKWFVPAERDGSADRRRLVTRIYSYAVR